MKSSSIVMILLSIVNKNIEGEKQFSRTGRQVVGRQILHRVCSTDSTMHRKRTEIAIVAARTSISESGLDPDPIKTSISVKGKIPPWAFACTAIWFSVVTICLIADSCWTGSRDCNFLYLAGKRILRSLKVVPKVEGFYSLLISLVSLPIAMIPLGLRARFMSWPPRRSFPWVTCAAAAVQDFIVPGLFEELIFRTLCLPGYDEIQADPAPFQRAFTYLLSLITFAIPYHLDALHHLAPAEALNVFKKWQFLVLALLLGIACEMVYLASGGSLWLAAMTHALPVWIWHCFLGRPWKGSGSNIS